MKNQEFIQAIFAGAEALDTDGNRDVAYLRWGGEQWILYWNWLEFDFYRDDLLVRVRKS